MEHQRNQSLSEEIDILRADLNQAKEQGSETHRQLSEVSAQLDTKSAKTESLEEQLALKNEAAKILESDWSKISNEYKKYKNSAELSISDITATVKECMMNLEEMGV